MSCGRPCRPSIGLTKRLPNWRPTLPDYSLFACPCLEPAPIWHHGLLVAFGEQRERFPKAEDLQEYAGIAPVIERSGKKCWVHWRWQCPRFLRQTFVEWAGQTINKSFWAGAYYRQQRAKGCYPPSGHPCLGIQVDSHPSSLLDNQNHLR